MKSLVVFVNGFAGSGKDTATGFMVAKLRQDTGIYAKSTSSIDPIRGMLSTIGVDTSAKTPETRDMLAAIKKGMDRNNWTATRLCMNNILGAIAYQANKWKRASIIFVHVREPEAIDFMQAGFLLAGVNSRCLKVERPGFGAVGTNDADASVDNMDYDLLISNNSDLRNLKAVCENMADDLKADYL